MHHDDVQSWEHGHCFGQDLRRPGERRTLVVIAITATMMVVEIVAGLAFSSMALLADGLHMGSHAVALAITAFAYIYARRHARDPRFSFGTGKVNALGGFTGAVLLATFALLMAAGSVDRLIHPAKIAIDYAIAVAVLGLVVNGICMVILNVKDHDHAHGQPEHAHGHDHNLRAAYLHVLADALTSVLAIVALLAAKYLGFTWMDPVMGLVGAVLVARWSFGLLRTTSAVLLDRQGPAAVRDTITRSIEVDGDGRVADLHLWSIGPGIYAAEIVVVAHAPLTADEYRARLPHDACLAHVTLEVRACAPDASGESCAPDASSESCAQEAI
jgi:cation diffusion facilitator family transporter